MVIKQIKKYQNRFFDIEKGKKILENNSKFDIGQSIVMQQGSVIGIEAAQGTDNLLRQSSTYINNKGVLIKLAKLNQDLRADLPTIGIRTLKNCHKFGICGVAYSANKTIFINKGKILEFCKNNNIFIWYIVKIVIITTEPSGDYLGFHLIKSLKKKKNISLYGVGGKLMKSQNFKSWVPIEQFNTIGLFEVLIRLPKFLKILNIVVRKIIKLKPDIIVTIDSPSFNYRVIKKVKHLRNDKKGKNLSLCSTYRVGMEKI